MQVTYRISFSENKLVGKQSKDKDLNYSELAHLLDEGGRHFAPPKGEGYDKTEVVMLVNGEDVAVFRLDMDECVGHDLREHLENKITFYETERGENFARDFHKQPAAEVVVEYAKFLGLTHCPSV